MKSIDSRMTGSPHLDYLVLWKFSEAQRVNGKVITKAEGTHASGLQKGDRMFIVATNDNELYLLGAIEVERAGKNWSAGKSLFGAFQILPLKTAKWKLRFASPNSAKLSREFKLARQVRARRKLTQKAALLLEKLLSEGIVRYEKQFVAKEGRLKEFTLSKRERDPRVRANALAERGTVCESCGFDFATIYGEFARNCVEVHHLRPLAKSKHRQVITSIDDVRVLCPNCHRALHRYDHPRDFERFRESCLLGSKR